MNFRTQYERTEETEDCRWFEAVACLPNGRYYTDVTELRLIAFRWFDWFRQCEISAAITRKLYKNGVGYIVYREGPRWKMKAQNTEPLVMKGEIIALYDEKGVFREDLRRAG